MTHQHTENHWHLGKRAGNPSIYGKNGEEIAEILHVLTSEWRENARIIAAAPDMLEALQNLENDDGSIPAHAWKLCQAAITKAISSANEKKVMPSVAEEGVTSKEIERERNAALDSLRELMEQAAKDAEKYAPDGNEPIWAFIADAADVINKITPSNGGS